jgi:hypothetical protein
LWDGRAGAAAGAGGAVGVGVDTTVFFALVALGVAAGVSVLFDFAAVRWATVFSDRHAANLVARSLLAGAPVPKYLIGGSPA